MDNKLPIRKKHRLKEFDYSSAGSYFITVCTSGKKKFFWEKSDIKTIDAKNLPISDIGKTVEKAITQIPEHYPDMKVDTYCIMPDHIHLLITVDSENSDYKLTKNRVITAVTSMKRWVSRQIGESIWQKSFYDHCIRNKQDYLETHSYIYMNPLQYISKNSDK